MINSATSNLNTAVANLASLGNQISNPDEIGDVGDIVAFKEAAVVAEVNVAVLKKILESQRLVDVIA